MVSERHDCGRFRDFLPTMICERYDCSRFRDSFAQGRDATNAAIRSCYDQNTKATCLHSDAIDVGTMIC